MLDFLFLPLNLENHLYPIEALVEESLSFELIIGMSFLKKYNASISLAASP